MTHDVTCGRCGGQFDVAPQTDEVACPHCGVTLAVPEDLASLGLAATLAPLDERVFDNSTASVFDSAAIRSGDVAFPVPSSIKAPDFTRWGKADSSAIKGAEPRTNPLASPTADALHSGEHADALAPQGSKQKELPVHSAAPLVPDRPVEKSVPAAASKTVATKASTTSLSRGTFLALLIYASAITAVCLGLAFFLLMSRQHQLESLPDVVPPTNDDGTITRVLVPADAPLPPGHELQLGESQRFGDLRVTPLKVTREPLEFVHFRGDEVREPAGDVLKLWLKFENVSDDGHAFAPFDENLLFYRTFDKMNGNRLKANNFVASRGHAADSVIPIYDHPIGSDWDLAGQHLGEVLEPGESLETYIPTEVDPAEAEGPLVWRMHLRKGIAPNGWGVTTLVEVTTPG